MLTIPASMPRRKPVSTKQRKAQLQEKRAIKRGDISPPPPPKPTDRQRKGRRSNTSLISAPSEGPSGQSLRSIALTESARRLQSYFVKLPKEFLDETKRLAGHIALCRPIPSDVAAWQDALDREDADGPADRTRPPQLTCPRRPKWRYEMSKKEVEKNEEGLFKKWLDQTDTILAETNSTVEIDASHSEDKDEEQKMPSAPTSFERNLEVWRQL